jgi:hypothetical protein
MRRNRVPVVFIRLWAVVVLATAVLVAPMPGAQAAPVAASPASAPDTTGATCVLLQPGPTIATDAYIKEEKQDERRGGDNEMRIKTETGKLMRSLLKFDMTGIPTNAVISSATMSLWVKDATGGPVTINAHGITASWTEAEVTWKARNKATALLWGALGGDYDPAIVSTAVVDDVKNVWRSWNVTSLAANWLANPAGNHGVMLESPVTNPRVEKRFKSSEDGTVLQRPKLEVCYNAAVSIQPDNNSSGAAGLTRTYAHVIHIGAITSAINIATSSSQNWPTRVYQDVNGNGLRDPEDTLISATPPLGPNVDYPILVQVDVPVSAVAGMMDTTTVTVTAQSTGATASATDRTQVGRMLNLQPDRALSATAGTVLFYGHTLTNTGETRDCIEVAATSSQGWTVLLWDDLNRNGVHETNDPNEPALGDSVCLNPGETRYLVAEVRVPSAAAAATVDQTIITAVSGEKPARFDTATDTTTVFVDSPPIIDGKYDTNYSDSPYSTEVCYNDVNGVLFGKLASYYQPAADAVYFVLAIDKDFVDNTYGTNAVGWPSGHTFGNLTGSDRAQFYGYDINGTKVLDFEVDYLTSTNIGAPPSGHASLGVTGGDGGMAVGSASSILEWGTSLAYSLNKTGYCSGGNCAIVPGGVDLKVNSPATTTSYAPNSLYPNFIYDVIYEVKVAMTAFPAGFGWMDIPYIHASPSKLGENTIYAEPGPCPGEIGDFVWHDQDGDTVQDPGEAGIANVQLKLYADNGDGYFDATKDTLIGTTTTDAGGRYLFQNLAPNDYFVDVVDATVPAGYKTTTYNDPTGMISLDAGEQYLIADFGYGTGAPIGDFVWEDLNHDGVQDPDEPGIAGVTVRLLDGSGNLLATTTTDGIGAYLFPNRPAGAYQVEFVLLPSYAFTAQGQGGNPAKDSDADPATGRTAVFTTTAVPDLFRDAGLIRGQGAIGDFVWYDSDGDGIEDVGEPGIANVTLDLYRDGAKVASTVTDADGGYLFPKLSAGNYSVDVTDLNNVLAGLTHVVAYQSQPDPTGTIALGAGELYKDADFGYVLGIVVPTNAIIGDTVWYDANGDKFQQPNEPGIPGIEVCAAPAGAGATICVTTDATGRYLIEVPAGSYTVAPANPPAGYTATTATSKPVTVAAAQQYLDADFGYNSPSLRSIGNLVFLDANSDGVFNGGDTPLGGVSVDLIRNTNGNSVWDPGEPVIATVTTATFLGPNNSNYLFTGVPEGEYLVHVSDTNGVLTDFSKSPLGAANADNNSQFDPYKVTLVSASVLTADFGYYPSSATPSGMIGNQVWIEKDGDGVFNPPNGDFGQAGVSVELLKDGVSYAATTTGPSGDYLFIGLDAGSYTVQVTDDLGVLGSYRVTRLGPDPAQDNNNQAQPFAINLLTAGRNLTADFGYILPGAIGDYVWYDSDADGIQDVGEAGIGNVSLRLHRDNGDGLFSAGSDTLVATALTDIDGGYMFTGLLGGGYFVDVDQLSPALAGLIHTVGPQSQADPFGLITLAQGQVYRDADFGYVRQPGPGNAVIGDTVWYDGDGDGLRDPGEPGIPGVQVCASPLGGGIGSCDLTDENGLYWLEVPAGTYTVAPVNPPGGYTPTTPALLTPVIVNAGDQYLDADFGYTSPDLARLGGTVWHDLGRDGLLDAGEPGIPSVSVDLIRDSNTNGVWDAGEPIIGTTTTDQAGNYEFKGLPPGYYLVDVSDTQNVLDDFVATLVGPDPGQDNNNQAQPYAVALGPGGVNTTADFGYVQSGSVDMLGVIGNQVWYEEDGDGLYDPESGDIGVAGVTVSLHREGLFLGATTTGASGDYIFTSLPAGNYTVAVVDSFGILSNLNPTILGPNPGQDNNNQAQPYAIALPGAGVNMTGDFGYTRPGAIGDFVWYDADGDGIEDAGEPGIANVTLDLYRDGVKVTSTVTDADGGYLFPKLPPGNYTVDVTDLNGVLVGLTHVVNRQSQPDPTATIDLGAGELYKDADFGYVKTPAGGNALIGDTVWYDANGDQFQQPGEPGIPGIEVCAAPVSGGTPSCVTTGATGRYLIEVPAGAYTVAPANPPAGYGATTPVPQSVTVTAGQQYLDADFGYNSPDLGSIGNLVFLDLNKDGMFNGSDPALGGVSVDLIRDANGNGTWEAGEPVIATVTTSTALGANTGNYLFTGLPAGYYLVHVSDTNGVLTDFTKSPLGTANMDGHSQADPYAVALPASGSILTADFGYWRMSRPDTGVIGNQVWIEKEGDGVFNPESGDYGQAGVTVELFKDGETYGKTTTGASGDYAFVGLPAGHYAVQVTDDYDVLTFFSVTLLGAAGQDNNNQAQPYAVALPLGGYNLTADFGYVAPNSSIGDTVFYDDDRNGVQGANEDGISAVIVHLYADNGGSCNQLIRSTTTDGSGKYIFPNLPPGHYCVVVPEAAGDNPSLIGLTRSAGTNPHEVNLAADQNYPDADFGYAGRGIIRGVVFFDINSDGVQQPTEPGIGNVQICLYPDVDKNGVPDSTTPLACATTDSFGVYVFPSQIAGSYSLTQTQPEGLSSTTPDTLATLLVVTQGSGLSDNNNFGETNGATYSISKVLTTTNNVRPNAPVSFDIIITNTGNSTIAVLPLRDLYDKQYLQFLNATPASVNTIDDGAIDWLDLTQSFGMDLAPGQSFTVKVNFIAKKDTGSLPGGVTINTAYVENGLADPDGSGPLGPILPLAVQTANDAVSIFTPTGVTIERFSAVAQAGGILLSWLSADEQDILGFNVLRDDGTGELVLVNGELILAQYLGTTRGASYSLVDVFAARDVAPLYILEVLKTDGSSERLDPVGVVAE